MNLIQRDIVENVNVGAECFRVLSRQVANSLIALWTSDLIEVFTSHSLSMKEDINLKTRKRALKNN